MKELGLKQYRLRRIENLTAKIECSEEDFKVIMNKKQSVVRKLKGLGFKTVTLDLEGYLCGKMNVLPGENKTGE